MDSLKFSVGHTGIDAIHMELAELVERVASARDADFRPLYSSMLEHTEAHFQHEEQLMQGSGFIHAIEHIGEHRQMLNEMRQFGRGPLVMAKAYLQHRLAERFSLHITRMDSLLVAFLRSKG